jgi:hypothetical protein
MEGFMRGLFTVMKPLRPLARLRHPQGRA